MRPDQCGCERQFRPKHAAHADAVGPVIVVVVIVGQVLFTTKQSRKEKKRKAHMTPLYNDFMTPQPPDMPKQVVVRAKGLT